MKLSKDELQYVLNAIDTHVRANGLTVAALGAILAKKTQDAFNKLPAASDAIVEIDPT